MCFSCECVSNGRKNEIDLDDINHSTTKCQNFQQRNSQIKNTSPNQKPIESIKDRQNIIKPEKENKIFEGNNKISPKTKNKPNINNSKHSSEKEEISSIKDNSKKSEDNNIKENSEQKKESTQNIYNINIPKVIIVENPKNDCCYDNPSKEQVKSEENNDNSNSIENIKKANSQSNTITSQKPRKVSGGGSIKSNFPKTKKVKQNLMEDLF